MRAGTNCFLQALDLRYCWVIKIHAAIAETPGQAFCRCVRLVEVLRLLPILVSHSYFFRFDEKQLQRGKPYPPLATLQVAALLREAGHDVGLFDAMLADGIEHYEAKLRAFRPQVVLFYEDNHNFLSKMCLGRMRRVGCDMIAIAHNAGARVIAAGSDASDAPEAYLAAGADAVLLGEGLAALIAIIDRLNSEPRMPVAKLAAGLPDVATANDGLIVESRPVAPLPTPGLAARPAWDLADIDAYREIWRKTHGYFSLNMAASRGCSFRCNWCAKPIWGDRYLQRQASDVAAEMLYLKQEFGIDHVWFADDIFGFRPDWVDEFATALEAGGSGVPFTIQLRADLIRPPMAEALQKAGCREVWIGAESGSQKILDAMNKGTCIPEILRARELLGACDIRVGFFLMLGYLGEELEDILATRDLVDCARPDDVGVSVAYPLPGTQFYQTVKRQLGKKKNWDVSNDLDVMFRGSYQSEFYRIVRDLLHDQVSEGQSAELQARWNDLVEGEALFRSAPGMPSNERVAIASVT